MSLVPLINPTWVQWLYTSSLMIRSCDCLLFLTLKGFPFFKRSSNNLNPFAIFAIRTYACCLWPFILQGFLLREYHIRNTEVGRVVGAAFIMEHVFDLTWYYVASRRVGKARDGFRVEPFTGIMVFHAGTTLWAIAGFIWA